MDHGSQHLTLNGRGNGDYEGEVNLEMPGSWDVDLTANKDGKSRQQKLSIEVGG
jgi:nitrogen fixation protein FixH